MLVARGSRVVGRAGIHWALGFGRGVWARAVASDGLVRDVRFLPAAPGPVRPSVCFVLMAGGFLEVFGPGGVRYGPRTAIAMTLEQWDGARGKRPIVFRMGGREHAALRLNFPESAIRALPPLPAAIELDEEAWLATQRATALATNSDAIFADAVAVVIRKLAAHGYLHEGAATRAEMPPPASIDRLWKAMKPLIEQMALGATMDVASDLTGLSSPQVGRAFQKLVSSLALVGPGLRGITLRLRIETALILLSAEGTSITEVSRAVGYGSVDAMARAFRDAGLDAPGVMRERIVGSIG